MATEEEKRDADVWVGIQVSTPVGNQRRYEQCVNMVLSFCEAHKDSLYVR